MAYTTAQAGKLLNASEFALFAASRASDLKTLTTARLRAKLKRARALRDKFRDLFKRQRLATRARTGSKAGLSGAANQRTRQKAEVFTEVLQRFEKRLAQLEAAESRAARTKAAAQARLVLSRKRRADAAKVATRQPRTSSKAPAKPPRRVTTGPQPTTERARSARYAMQANVAGQQAIRGHVSTKGRRNQAKRDNRG
ncbi:MAG: hypothetical protein IPP91_16210 [Betaproteobacteria bacterium]|nr:hypothetical protein [Betaproteobacteria bacterium]